MKEKTKAECDYCKEVVVVEHSTYEAVGYCPMCGTEITTEMMETLES